MRTSTVADRFLYAITLRIKLNALDPLKCDCYQQLYCKVKEVGDFDPGSRLGQKIVTCCLESGINQNFIWLNVGNPLLPQEEILSVQQLTLEHQTGYQK